MEIFWSQDSFKVNRKNLSETLTNFNKYKTNELLKYHHHDFVILLTNTKYYDEKDATLGFTLLEGMCSLVSSSVVVCHGSLAEQATTMAHEIGHSLGMDHDVDADCICPEIEGCIMAEKDLEIVPKFWSSCNINQLNTAMYRGVGNCLINKPAKVLTSKCGNGYREYGEECDCGPPDLCKSSCCNPFTCKLKLNAFCDTGECCDLSTCKPFRSGKIIK